ncbi:MAG: hypothetical protein DLM68_09860 [Hyphomicrobiales bacterium]|nr:MAG: hypothetical protein DLM68_09860 [Hyphomicrobiales bacterium]
MMAAAMRVAMKRARRLHNDQRDIVGGHRALQQLQTVLVIGQGQPLAGRMEIDVESCFTGVESADLLAWRRSWAVPCLACGTCSPSSGQDQMKGGRVERIHGPQTKGLAILPARLSAGGHPRRPNRISIRFWPIVHPRVFQRAHAARYPNPHSWEIA